MSRRLVQTAEECAKNAGPYLLDQFRTGSKKEIKGGYHDLVTEADRAVERMISEYIFRNFPSSEILGEEGGRRGNGDLLWIVDPIDGTNNFASGIPLFCVSIAAVFRGEMLAGIVFEPVRNEMFTASLDGAFLNGLPMSPSGGTAESESLLLTGFPYEGGKAGPADFDIFSSLVGRFRAVRRLGSTALELAYTACGRADITFQTNANPWDVAAGMFLVNRAGGKYSIPGNGNPGMQDEPWMSPRFIAAGAKFNLERSCLRDLLFSQAEH